MKFEDVYGWLAATPAAPAEAVEIPCISDRTFRRWPSRYQADGLEGPAGGRLGKVSATRVPID